MGTGGSATVGKRAQLQLLTCVPCGVPGWPGGAYDLEGLAEHLHRRGLYKTLLDSIMTLDGRVSQRQHRPQGLHTKPCWMHVQRTPPRVLACASQNQLLACSTAWACKQPEASAVPVNIDRSQPTPAASRLRLTAGPAE